MYAIREALWDKPAEVPEPVSEQLPESTLSRINAARAVPEQAPETASMVPRLLHRALIGLAVLVAAVAVGYVVGPIIEKHWVPSPIASQPVTPPDQRAPAKSLEELRKLADAGDAEAQWQMGLRYHNGDGVPHDDAQSMQWFLRAAEQGHVTAQATLGAYYWAAAGLPEDLSKAYFWSAIANARGDEASRFG